MRKMCECGIASECNIEFSVALLNSPSNLPCCVYVCVFEFECVCVCLPHTSHCVYGVLGVVYGSGVGTQLNCNDRRHVPLAR